MKILFFILFLNYFGFAQQQEIHSENFFWPYEYNLPIDGIIGEKKCYVRENPSINNTPIDSLEIGSSIKVLTESESNLTFRGLTLPWVEIEYQKANETKKGYLWKGFIALGESHYGNIRFITSLNKKTNKKVTENNDGYKYDYLKTFYDFKISVCNASNQIIADKTFEHSITDNYFFTNSTIDNCGLKDVVSIYQAVFNGEACAVPTEYKYFYWNGKNLDFLLEKYNVGDTNAYYYSEDVIFPNENGGRANTIIKQIEEAVNIGDTFTSSKFQIKKSTQYFSWNGKKIKLIKTLRKKPYISNLE
jgi:hypothetical protein